MSGGIDGVAFDHFNVTLYNSGIRFKCNQTLLECASLAFVSAKSALESVDLVLDHVNLVSEILCVIHNGFHVDGDRSCACLEHINIRFDNDGIRLELGQTRLECAGLALMRSISPVKNIDLILDEIDSDVEIIRIINDGRHIAFQSVDVYLENINCDCEVIVRTVDD